MAARRWRSLCLTLTLKMTIASAVYRNSSCRVDQIACADETCIGRAQECDGDINCPDASDEMLQRCQHSGRPMWPIALHCSVSYTRELHQDICLPICLHQPELCMYAMMSLTQPLPGMCQLPDWPENGHYTVEEAESYATFSLHYSCSRGYDLVGTNYVRCEDCVWRHEQPRCKFLSGWGVPDEDLR